MQKGDKGYFKGFIAGECTILSVSTDGSMARVVFNPPNDPRKHEVLLADILPAPTEEPAQKIGLRFYSQTSRLMNPAPIHYREQFEPHIVLDARWPENDGFAIVAIAVRMTQCLGCGRLLCEKPYDSRLSLRLLDEWMVRADTHAMCAECQSKKIYICSLCRKQCTEMMCQVHNQTHCLCNECYKTTPADKWDDEKHEIRKADDDYDEGDDWDS